MPLLFSYGTLQDPVVQLALFGRRLTGAPDELLGYAQTSYRVTDSAFVAASGKADHAIVRYTGADEDHTAGTALEVTEADLTVADAYEPPGYFRVAARLASGREAWVYAEA